MGRKYEDPYADLRNLRGAALDVAQANLVQHSHHIDQHDKAIQDSKQRLLGAAQRVLDCQRRHDTFNIHDFTVARAYYGRIHAAQDELLEQGHGLAAARDGAVEEVMVRLRELEVVDEIARQGSRNHARITTTAAQHEVDDSWLLRLRFRRSVS